MVNIEETPLPGVGVRHDFATKAGARIGVVTHRTGYRELLVYDAADPDRCRDVVRLDDDDSHALAELLGGSRVTDTLTRVQQAVEGLAIDWLPIDEGSACAGGTIGDYRVRTQTGVSIVAVIRGDEPHPAPGPDFRLQPGDTVVVVGTETGIEEAAKLLQGF